MKPHLTRCAIGGACAALIFMLVTASPAFADGTAEHGSAVGHGSSHENVFGGRDPDGESSGTPASRVRSDPTEEPTSPAHADPAESQPADSPKCAPRAEATTVSAHRGGEFVPVHEDVDAAPIANLPDVAVPALPSNPPDEPVVTPTPGRVAVPVAVTPTPSGGIVPAPAGAGAGTGAALAFAVLPAAPIEQLVPANTPAVASGDSGGAPPLQGVIGIQPVAPSGVASPIGDSGGAQALGGAMIALLGAMLAFVLLHGRLDRSEAKLTRAPLDDHDQSLDFQ